MAKNTAKNTEDYNKKIRAKWDRKSYVIACNSKTEIDIIDKLKSVPNRSDYIRQLILADIKRASQQPTPKGSELVKQVHG